MMISTKEKTIKFDELYRDLYTNDIVCVKDIKSIGSGYIYDNYAIQITVYNLTKNENAVRIIYIFTISERNQYLKFSPSREELINIGWQNFNIMYEKV